MTLLNMNTIELAQKIDRELAQNPALELVEERRCPTCRRRLTDPGPCSICSRPQGTLDEPIVFVSSRDDFLQGRSFSIRNTGDYEFPEDNYSASDDLPTYVMRQIATEIDPEDREIAAHILTSLDENGLLPTSIFEISKHHHVPTQRVEDLLDLIRRAEPIGVGSLSVKQALLTQIEVLAESHPIPTSTVRAVQEGLDLLSRRQYAELAKLLDIPVSEAEKTAEFIGANLNPYPARAYWGDIHQGNENSPQVYHYPDILLRTLDSRPNSPLVIEILSSVAGTLRINPLFRQVLGEAPKEKLENWKEDLEKANLLIKCIQQRNNTIQRMMFFLATLQRDFILRGDQYLRPITRAKVAEELGVHESTISRAVSGKTVQLPNGHIIPLEQFFDRSLHIRAILRQIIKNEKETLTDTQLAAHLSAAGHRIARRTVAKYRAMEGILPAHLRKNLTKPI
jgi:RNA polymerase sigma-54 factor